MNIIFEDPFSKEISTIETTNNFIIPQSITAESIKNDLDRRSSLIDKIDIISSNLIIMQQQIERKFKIYDYINKQHRLELDGVRNRCFLCPPVGDNNNKSCLCIIS